MEPITVTAAAKLLLSGEHAVLAGAPAAGMPLPLRLRLTLTPMADSATGDGVRFAPRYAEPLERYRPFIVELERELQACGVGGARIDIDSDIPVGSGLGSSAALCVACATVLNALHSADDRPPQDRTEYIWNTAHRLERHFHGRSSGIDTGIIAADAPTLFFHRRRPLAGTQITTPYSHYRRQLIANLRIAMAIIVLPRHRTTKQMVATIAQHGAVGQNGAIEQSAAPPPANDDPQMEEHATMDGLLRTERALCRVAGRRRRDGGHRIPVRTAAVSAAATDGHLDCGDRRIYRTGNRLRCCGGQGKRRRRRRKRVHAV